MKSLTWSNISIIRLGQECLWRLCVILPVISARWTAISYFCMLPGGEKMPKLSCIAPLLQHPDVVNQRLNVVHVAVPKVTGRNEKSVCGVQSIHKHPTHPLKSDSALKKSNFVKQHIMRGAGGGGVLGSRGRGAARHPPAPPENAIFYQRSPWCFIQNTPLVPSCNTHEQSLRSRCWQRPKLDSLHQGSKSQSPIINIQRLVLS